MPRRLSSAEVELRARLAEARAELDAHREAERPLRHARAKLSRACGGHLSKVRKFQDKLIQAIKHNVVSGGLYAFRVERAEEFLRPAEAAFNSAVLTLRVFDAVHQIDAESYPEPPPLHRSAVEAEARNEKAAAMQAFRTRYGRRTRAATTQPREEPQCTP